MHHLVPAVNTAVILRAADAENITADGRVHIGVQIHVEPFAGDVTNEATKVPLVEYEGGWVTPLLFGSITWLIDASRLSGLLQLENNGPKSYFKSCAITGKRTEEDNWVLTGRMWDYPRSNLLIWTLIILFTVQIIGAKLANKIWG